MTHKKNIKLYSISEKTIIIPHIDIEATSQEEAKEKYHQVVKNRLHSVFDVIDIIPDNNLELYESVPS